MPNKYNNFAELCKCETEGKDFRRVICSRNSGVAIIAPHGGKIEKGTSEIATAIAGNLHSSYLLEGIKTSNNCWLHVASENFDDPECLDLVSECDTVIAVHGKNGDGLYTQFGGLDNVANNVIKQSLEASGFNTDPDTDNALSGRSDKNICNRGRSLGGVQLEIRHELRVHLIDNPDQFSRYSRAISTAIGGRLIISPATYT